MTEDENETLQYPTELLNSFLLSGLPSHTLELKSSTIVILLRYLKPTQGLLSRARIIVKSM